MAGPVQRVCRLAGLSGDISFTSFRTWWSKAPIPDYRTRALGGHGSSASIRVCARAAGIQQRTAVQTSNVARRATEPVAQVSHEATCSRSGLANYLKSLVVCAVRYEPVSACNSLLTGKLTGNFAIPRLLDAISARKAPVPQRFPGKFPTKINREIISRNREFFAGIREFRVTDVSVHFSHTCSFDVRTRLFSPTNLRVRTTRCPTNFDPASATARLFGERTMRRGATASCSGSIATLTG
jgi:hypothetical protein